MYIFTRTQTHTNTCANTPKHYETLNKICLNNHQWKILLIDDRHTMPNKTLKLLLQKRRYTYIWSEIMWILLRVALLPIFLVYCAVFFLLLISLQFVNSNLFKTHTSQNTHFLYTHYKIRNGRIFYLRYSCLFSEFQWQSDLCVVRVQKPRLLFFFTDPFFSITGPLLLLLLDYTRIAFTFGFTYARMPVCLSARCW